MQNHTREWTVILNPRTGKPLVIPGRAAKPKSQFTIRYSAGSDGSLRTNTSREGRICEKTGHLYREIQDARALLFEMAQRGPQYGDEPRTLAEQLKQEGCIEGMQTGEREASCTMARTMLEKASRKPMSLT
ncbi:hypothetical protein EF589_10500 [Salmonella enterica]|nr:hypothetical protein [Salmonella enterica]EAR1628716.1 hypothetical protein [Salmonella enterica]EAR3203653.1 hypothetical protein [Salmonella enterica]EAT3567841.1 hypothetical protein [Salmonella enterica]EBO4520274.1 hypothetical protein [Salmonella enterica]